ncbi:hypothetical protein CAPTEDRAFT_224946 [Capitella teleta]|uniref:Uncharacterized protein n=1 Tax=Capitella teleta TaxID=283909 RepID=R7THL6_CAPTE|nr:hypothetical protein CAPTEDRAFT_224946 [Capitella teleta]|eukprot:ELT92952.1 hypothetical protein CAPTEDRAFT_224946 [Capitella teleta]
MDKFYSLLVVALFAVVCRFGANSQNTEIRSSRPRRQRLGRQQSFEDYLVRITAPRGAAPAAEGAEETTSERPQSTTEPAPVSLNPLSGTTEQILAYLRDVPRQHWSCCMLGMLAGNKGFSCHPGFYAARLTARNYNRAHSRRMPLHTPAGERSRWGLDIMTTFGQCVTRNSSEFHKCCYAATIETRELTRFFSSQFWCYCLFRRLLTWMKLLSCTHGWVATRRSGICRICNNAVFATPHKETYD